MQETNRNQAKTPVKSSVISDSFNDAQKYSNNVNPFFNRVLINQLV